MSDVQNEVVPTVLTYGTHTFAIVDLPVASQFALMQSGLSHKLGNEVSAKVVAWTKKNTTDDGVAPDDAAVEAFKSEAFAAMVAAINDGTLGTRVGGPRGPKDTIGDKAVSLARDVVVAALASRGIKMTQKEIDSKADEYYAAKKDHFRALAEREMAKAAKVTDEALDALFAKSA